jgi:hypothetical protein
VVCEEPEVKTGGTLRGRVRLSLLTLNVQELLALAPEILCGAGLLWSAWS